MIARGSVLYPVLASLIALTIGAGMTWSVWLVETERSESEFERTADLAVNRVVTRLEQHVVLLQSARGLFLAQRGSVDRDTFGRFLTGVDLVNDLSGIQGIGYARMVATGDEKKIVDDVMTRYGLAAEIRPATDQPWRASIVLIEPANERNIAALGFDMYAEEIRRAAMERAIASGQPQMSGPVHLVQEITSEKQHGVLIYLSLPATSNAPASGFVYAPFRGGDLIRAALSAGPPLSVLMTIRDSGAPDRAIFDEGAESATGWKLSRSVELVGRQWVFTVAESDGSSAFRRHLGSFLVGVISVLFAAAAGLAVRSRQHEATQALEVVAATARESDYRDLLLQEMKHRIKNHIARIQSIARQSARGATDVKAFSDTFDARLQAMAAVQEILAGTAVAQADVRAILRRELQQCLDTAEVEHLMDGPSVILDERQAHAFALVSHELVTNAMKYGGLSANGRGLRITWSVRPGSDDAPPMLTFDWQEQFTAQPDASTPGAGFGSRLIDVSLKGELSGTMTRDFHAQGLHITLSFPLKPDLIKSLPRKR